MSQYTLLSQVDRTTSYPVKTTVSAPNNCGTLILMINTPFTEQQLCELPSVNVRILTGANEVLYNFDILLSTVNTNVNPIGSIEPYSIPIYDVPQSFKLIAQPIFDNYALSAHNECVECGNVEILQTVNGIVSQDVSSYLWTTPTQTFDISVYFDNSNVKSGGSSGGGGGGGGTPGVPTTTTGVPPLDFTSDGTPITDFYIEANMVQTGTPSTANPATVQEFGDLVTSGEHAGMYAIDINVGGTTKTIYLTEPLRKIGSYTDKIESDGTVTRKIARIILDGTEPWGYTSGMHKLPFDNSTYTPPKYLRELELISMCTHYTAVENKPQASINNGELTFLVSSSGTNNMYIRDTDYADATEFKAYLANQYSANTPVCVWYIMANETTETVTIPTITPSTGNNTLTLGTTISPTDMSITCVSEGSGGGGASTAVDVSYDNSMSGLTATNVQDAITELASMQTTTVTTEKTVTLLAANWNNGSYQLADSAIKSTSDIYINVPDGITKSQYDALAYANIISVGQTNGYVILSALRTVPTIDVPVRIVIKTTS